MRGSHTRALCLARGNVPAERTEGTATGAHRACSAFTISFLTPFTLENLFLAFVCVLG